MTAPGAQAATFYAELEANNTKEWFAANKARYEAEVKAPMAALLEAAEARYGGRIKLFRPNRDIRFAKDKSPYKTACYGAVYAPDRTLGHYAAVDANGFFAGMGAYDFGKEALARFRAAVDGPEGAALAEAIETSGLTVSGSSLKTAPRGYDRDHPRVDLLRLKNFIVGERIPAAEMHRAEAHALDVWARAAPISAWMDLALA